MAIDEEEKYKRFGYHSYDLSLKSGRKIVAVCDDCGKVREVEKKAYKPFCLSCSRRGERSPRWKGGEVERIRDKFDRKCFICGKTEEENCQKLSVHHVNYSKDCLCDDDKSCQFVPLCASGHAKTNFNCGYWEALIMAKLRARIDGYYI